MMKNATITMLLGLFSLIGFAQDSTSTNFKIKDYSLRDYVAPDIKFRRLDASMNLNSKGNEDRGNGYGYINFRFNRYVNTTQKQAQSVAGLGSSFNSNWTNSNVGNYNNVTNLLYFNNQSRIYKGNESFWGVHDMADYQYFGSFIKDADSINPYSQVTTNRINITFFLSHGKGRIEPVASARKAMDILISLEKYNRLAKKPDVAMVDSLARIANRVTYKRFFDKRYKRVYQLDELDKGIQSLGLVTDPDMIYAANLSDIWDFAFDFNRGSGQRIEYGVVPVFRLNNNSRVPVSGSLIPESNVTNLDYGIYGFGSWNKLTPLSYKWQSDVMVDLTAGWLQSETMDSSQDPTETVSALLNLSWSLGYYPTTRTYMAITPFVRTSIGKTTNSSESYGAFTGMDFRSYYYLSPRFRVSVFAKISYGSDDYNYETPTPFWNTTATTMHAVTTKTDVITSPNLLSKAFNTGSDGFSYEGRITLSYAIF